MIVRSFLALALAATLMPSALADVAPKLAVYDFTVNGSVPQTVGAQFAGAVASELRTGGGVNVVTGPPALAAARDRDDARSQGADYYLTGAVAPLTTRYSVICQLVSVRTGLLVWSSTLQAGSADDLRGQGALVRQILADQIGRTSFPTVSATAPQSPAPQSSAPAPASSTAAVALAAGAAPLGSPSPAATFAVVTFGGSALPSDRAFAVRTVLESIRRRGASAVTDTLQPQDLSVSGAQACMDTAAATVVGGTLETMRTESASAPTAATATVALQVYDCRTQRLFTGPLAGMKAAPISSDAIRDATGAALAGYFGGASPAPHP